ncbi:hypothetical protein COX05_04665 [candidate division WWE3 bacterium CG22_combo_CG10-13_8_21_14_all_39_12]|uniref:Uncharacterized protein n=2 Tax=Katanobacteria TaxID=422282 RepID=A0A2M7X4S9_UNCKA|nr:MAG: hypothetical protein COX05_04665 [candidate division WWE3 bacterium CG22_combo_CG10-13_8_21_14_all_39_12]PJA41185.1 MAG: hypothetical protein CO179_00430 [candidate division WWE3 bacterium CG_4_9_14_3_um_filter_39_7]
MSDQNVQKLVTYITENSQYSLNQLESASLKAGYTAEEFNVAIEKIDKPSTESSALQNSDHETDTGLSKE